MGDSNVLKEYFLFIENNREIEDGNYPEASELMCRIRDTALWNIFIERSFDGIDLQEYFTSVSSEIKNKIFKFGISCFVHFVQANFTGPDLSRDVLDIFKNPKIKKIDFPAFLSLNNEEINENTKYPILLVVSQCIFERCLVSDIVNSLWTLRTIMIHQQIRDELSTTLLERADALKKSISTFELQGYEKAKFDIEIAQLYLIFHQVFNAKEHIYSADGILGVQFNLQGKVVKKPKQEKSTARLTLDVKLSTDIADIVRPPVLDFELPAVLNTNESVDVIIIPNTEQKLFLTRAYEMILSKPQEDLHFEELEPFIELLINQKNTWAVRVAALLLQCRIELKFQRKTENTMAQCKEILDCYNRSAPHILTRFADVFGTGLIPMWKVENQCADVLLNLGLVKHALDIYVRVKHWKSIIFCHILLKSQQELVETIKAELEKKETVKMFCILGDATNDVTCYAKAWELSRKRSHRVQRQWGHHFYNRKQYQDCMDHYAKSCSINPLQPKVWLKLAHAAQMTENWHSAATAYRRYLTMEPEGYQAWYNLAQAYIKFNNKLSAQDALLEALKYNSENWRTWENLLIVSTDNYSYKNIIKAYHKLLDIKGRYLNLEALNILIFNVCNDLSDERKRTELRNHDEPDDLMQKCRELVGRVLTLFPGEGYLWELYASLVPPSLLRALRYQRAFRAYAQFGWEKNPQTCVQVMCLCIKLAELVLTKGVDLQDHLLGTVKNILANAVNATKQHDWEESRTLVNEVSVHLKKLVSKVKELAEKNSDSSGADRFLLS